MEIGYARGGELGDGGDEGRKEKEEKRENETKETYKDKVNRKGERQLLRTSHGRLAWISAQLAEY